MITYILELKIGTKRKEWRSWNMKPLVHKLIRLKQDIPTFIRGFSAPKLEAVIRYFLIKDQKNEVTIRLTEEKNLKKEYFLVKINQQGDIIKDDNNCY